jgi:hypothetical protein
VSPHGILDSDLTSASVSNNARVVQNEVAAISSITVAVRIRLDRKIESLRRPSSSSRRISPPHEDSQALAPFPSRGAIYENATLVPPCTYRGTYRRRPSPTVTGRARSRCESHLHSRTESRRLSVSPLSGSAWQLWCAIREQVSPSYPVRTATGPFESSLRGSLQTLRIL